MEKIISRTIFSGLDDPQDAVRELEKTFGINRHEIESILIGDGIEYFQKFPEFFEIMYFIDYSDWETVLINFCLYFMNKRSRGEKFNYIYRIPEPYSNFILKYSDICNEGKFNKTKLITLMWWKIKGTKLTQRLLNPIVELGDLRTVIWFFKNGGEIQLLYTKSLLIGGLEIMDYFYSNYFEMVSIMIHNLRFSMFIFSEYIDIRVTIDWLLAHGYKTKHGDYFHIINSEKLKMDDKLLILEDVLKVESDMTGPEEAFLAISDMRIIYLFDKYGVNFSSAFYSCNTHINKELFNFLFSKGILPEKNLFETLLAREDIWGLDWFFEKSLINDSYDMNGIVETVILSKKLNSFRWLLDNYFKSKISDHSLYMSLENKDIFDILVERGFIFPRDSYFMAIKYTKLTNSLYFFKVLFSIGVRTDFKMLLNLTKIYLKRFKIANNELTSDLITWIEGKI